MKIVNGGMWHGLIPQPPILNDLFISVKERGDKALRAGGWEKEISLKRVFRKLADFIEAALGAEGAGAADFFTQIDQKGVVLIK